MNPRPGGSVLHKVVDNKMNVVLRQPIPGLTMIGVKENSDTVAVGPGSRIQLVSNKNSQIPLNMSQTE